MAERRPRLLVLNQYYWPGLEATAFLLSQLCEALADEFDVTVVTGTLSYPPAGAGWTEREGVRILRVRSLSLDRANLLPRAANYLTYLVQTFRSAVALPRPDLVLCMTDPPIIGDLAWAIANRFRVPFVVISQDVFPEIAVELHRLENPFIVGFLRRAIRFYLRRADRVVAIGETMRDRLADKGAPRDRMRVIPNWVDTGALTPRPKDNPWSREQGVADKFVVMHSGNIGHAQNLDALVRATTFLRDLDDLAVLIAGNGARQRALVELAVRLEADKVTFLPYQDRSVLPESLSAASIHVVGLAPKLAGYVVPSRLYGILSIGRPVIVAADAESETAKVVERVGCGVVIPPGRPDLLATAIRDAHDGRYDLDEMGRRGREYVMAEADRRVAVDRYRRLLWELVPR